MLNSVTFLINVPHFTTYLSLDSMKTSVRSRLKDYEQTLGRTFATQPLSIGLNADDVTVMVRSPCQLTCHVYVVFCCCSLPVTHFYLYLLACVSGFSCDTRPGELFPPWGHLQLISLVRAAT